MICKCGVCKDCNPEEWMRERRESVGCVIPAQGINGVTLRDQIAIAAMNAILSYPSTIFDKDAVAKMSYEYADEMMGVRER